MRFTFLFFGCSSLIVGTSITTSPHSIAKLLELDSIDDIHVVDSGDEIFLDKWKTNFSKIKSIVSNVVQDDTSRDHPTRTLIESDFLNSRFEKAFGDVYFRLVKDLGKRFTTHVFKGACYRLGCSEPQLIFKYETNCEAKRHNQELDSGEALTARSDTLREYQDEDPLLKEYVISKIVCNPAAAAAAAGTDGERGDTLCPQVISLSRSMPLRHPKIMSGKKIYKFDFSILSDPKRRKSCLETTTAPSVRLLVEEVAGKDLEKYYRSEFLGFTTTRRRLSRQNIMDCLEIFSHIIRALEQLHNDGFVHGDIHAKKIILVTTTTKSSAMVGGEKISRVKLIDFGESRFFPIEIGAPEIVGIPWNLNPDYLSCFQFENSRQGRRDDIFRAFEVLINMLTKFKYMDYLREFSWYTMYPVKISRQIFDPDFKYDYKGISSTVGKILAVPEYTKFRDILVDMLGYVRGQKIVDGRSHLNHPDARPNYDWIVEQTRQLIYILAN